MPPTYIDLSPKPNAVQLQSRQSRMRGLRFYGFQALAASAVGAVGFYFDPQNRATLYLGMAFLSSAAAGLAVALIDQHLFGRGYVLEERARLGVLLGVMLGAAGVFMAFGMFVLASVATGLAVTAALFMALTWSGR